jgi:hypothetical protein
LQNSVTNSGQTLPDIIIRSEEDAYTILQKASKGEIEPYGSIKFDGWPTLNLYFKGKKFEQSITPTVMHGLLEMQRGLYRSYATAKFGNPTRRLSNEEKDALEIKVDVKGGSSSFDINFQELAVKMVEQIGGRMNPTEVLYSIVSIAVLYFGTSAYKSYLENRKEIRTKEISDETQKEALSVMKFSSEQETKRTAILAELAKKDPRIENIERLAFDTHTEIIKSMSAASESKLDGISLSPEVTEFLTQNARRKSNEVRLDGEYRLLKLDWSDSTKFKVKVFNVQTHLQLDAEVQDDSLTGKYKEAIKAAEWSRKSLRLKINAKLLGEDDYRDAVIVAAESIDAKV